MDSELVGLTRSLAPAVLGDRLRNHRLAAGLTQSQLAAGIVTPGSVSRIESGRRRVTPRVLEQLCSRLGVPVGEVLRGADTRAQEKAELDLDWCELAVATGRATDVLGALRQIVAGPTAPADGPQERRARQCLALALESTGDLQGAILLLEDLASAPQPDASWLTALIALSRTYRESGDLDRAVGVGDRAQGILEDLGLDGLPEAVQLSVTVAAAHIARGDLDLAMRICERALAAAEAIDSGLARASAYWNASIVESRRGRTDAALGLARRALVQFELSDDLRNIGRLRTQVASLYLRREPPDPTAASTALDRADDELRRSSASRIDRADHHLTRARVDHLRGDDVQARAWLGRALEAGGSSPLLLARARALEGEIALAGDDHPGARDAFQAAVLALTAVGADREVGQLWLDLGGLLDEVGLVEQSRDCYRRAAVCVGLRPSSAAHPVSRHQS